MLTISEKVSKWLLPQNLSNEKSYGLWNCLVAFGSDGKEIGVIEAHDGDFFPESPDDYIRALRSVVLANEPDFHAMPVRVDVDVNQDCSDQCYFCYSRNYAKQPLYRHAQIPASVFYSIVEQLSQLGVKTIRFTGGGEPLLHSDICTLLKLPASFNMKSCVITNGTLLDEQICNIIVDHVDHLRISINAATNKTRNVLHRPLMRKNSIDQIFDYLSYITTQRKTRWKNQRKPLIWSTFLIVPENISEIVVCAERLRACGVDSISYRPIYHGLKRPFSESEHLEVQEQFRLVSKLHNPPFFHVFFPKRGVEFLKSIKPYKHFDFCISCLYRTIIETSNQGVVLQKCWSSRGNYNNRIGTLDSGVLFNEVWRQFVNNQTQFDLKQKCNSCIDISMNITLHSILKILNKDPEAVFYKGVLTNKFF